MNIHQNNAGHMTKMAAMPIYSKIFFQGTTWPILMTLCVKHQIPKRFIFSVNYGPGLILAYFRQCEILQLRLLHEKK